MNPYHQFVSEYARLAAEGRKYPLGRFPFPSHPRPAAGAPTALIFSPHPDDEVIIGGLALRLLREARWNVINVAVTQGSNKERQSARYKELQDCCRYIGFELVQTAPHGLEKINPKTRDQDASQWSRSVQRIADILSSHRPRAILCPHELDWNSTHIGTHYLVMDALRSLPEAFECFVVETEFWGQMATPNLMVELSPDQLGEMITALTFHMGEVQRNPYHLTLPAWMVDNVRRGSELVGGQGGSAPQFTFATLYRLQKWQRRQLAPLWEGGKQLGCDADPAALFA